MKKPAKRAGAKISAAAILLLLGTGMLNARGAFAAAASLELKPGKYELTITYEVQDQRQNESRTATRCIRARDLNEPEKIFTDRTGDRAKEEEACSVKNLKSAEGQISYDADCLNRTVHVQGSMSDAEFSIVRTVTPKASQGVSLKFTVQGTRAGECSVAGK